MNIKYIHMKNLKKLNKEELKTIAGGSECVRMCFVNDKLTCVPYSSCGGPALQP
ncbi:bacteriocin-like protein [Chryseobacterium gleum]|nr:bacteriocin [Chryseobacterium gleum]